MDDVEIVTRVERRRKWTSEERAALLAEIEAEGGRVTVVARRHKISESLLYNWRSAQKAASSLAHTAKPMEFLLIGVFSTGDKSTSMAERERPRDRAGLIEVDLPNGTRIRVDAFVNEKALWRVFRAMKGLA